MRDYKALESVLKWYYLKLPTLRTATDADLIRYRNQLESLRADAISQSMVASYEPGARPENLAPSDPVNTQVARILAKSGETQRWIEIAIQQREQLTRAHNAITAALGSLPPEQRIAIYKHYHDKITYIMLGAQEYHDESTVRKRMAQTLKTLDSSLIQYFFETTSIKKVNEYLLSHENFRFYSVSVGQGMVCV